MRPAPRAGYNPAVPGVNCADAPGRMSVGTGDSTARALLQSLNNPDLTGNRILAVSVRASVRGDPLTG